MSYQVYFSFYAPEQSVQVITGAPTIEIIANEENKIDRKKEKENKLTSMPLPFMQAKTGISY